MVPLLECPVIWLTRERVVREVPTYIGAVRDEEVAQA
jgi:hypothetical protein